MSQTASTTRRLQTLLSRVTPLLAAAALAGCGFDSESNTIADIQAGVIGQCLYEPAGVYRPECRSSWSNSDATPAIHESIALVKQYIDATDCDIRTTSQRSPYNANEPWCGGVVFQSGIQYPMPSSVFGTIGQTFTSTSLNDPLFGVTLEADDRFGPRPILQLPAGSGFGIGPHDRLRHLHIRGPRVPYTTMEWCSGSFESDCYAYLNEVGVYANGLSATETNAGWRIDDVRVEGFRNYGIQAHWSTDASITNSIVNGNGNGGIYGLGSLRLYVGYNQVYQNGANGIDMGEAIGYSIIENNTVYDNGWRKWPEQQGIILAITSNNIVRNNTIAHSPCGPAASLPHCWGVIVVEGSNNQILDNTVYGHSEAGIQVGWCHPTLGCTAGMTSNTLVSGNTLFSNATSTGYQIEAEGSMNGTTFSNNLVTPPGTCMNFPSGGTFYGNTCRPHSPFGGIQADHYDAVNNAWPLTDGGIRFLAGLQPGTWAKYENVNFGSTPARSVTFKIGVDPSYVERRIEIRLGSPTGTLIGNLIPQSTGGWYTFAEQTTRIIPTTGTHNVYLVTNAWGGGSIDQFKFSTADFLVNGFSNIEGESFDATNGPYADASVGVGAVGGFGPGYWVRYRNVVFDQRPRYLAMRLAADPCCAGQPLEVRLNSPTGTRIGIIYPANTGGWWNFQQQTISINMPYPYIGSYDIYLVNAGGWGGANIDDFAFEP